MPDVALMMARYHNLWQPSAATPAQEQPGTLNSVRQMGMPVNEMPASQFDAELIALGIPASEILR